MPVKTLFHLASLATCSLLSAEITSGFDSPESIATDGTAFYISNLGKKLEPTAKDGDGRISKVDANGKILEADVFPSETLHGPKGLAVVNGVLYVADLDRLLGFSLATGKMVLELSFASEKTLFLNDIAAGKNGTLFVSSTDTNRIYRVSLEEKDSPAFETLSIEGLKGPNGLAYSEKNDALYVVGFGTDSKATGRIGVVESASSKTTSYRELSQAEGYFDGVSILGEGKKLLVSDWVGFGDKQGALRVLDLATGKLGEPVLSGVGGPADFSYDESSKTLRLPRMMEGKVEFTSLVLP